jgi:predicted ATPase
VALQLCHRLDNLPLALELAAARLRSMPLQDLLAGVEHRFALLDHALRGLPDRHQGLWAMVDWSWALLNPASRALLRDLAVVPAPFTADLATSVAAHQDADSARVVLAQLVDQSLLALEESGDGRPARYRMLETVREYGEARLAADDARDLRSAPPRKTTTRSSPRSGGPSTVQTTVTHLPSRQPSSRSGPSVASTSRRSRGLTSCCAQSLPRCARQGGNGCAPWTAFAMPTRWTSAPMPTTPQLWPPWRC